MISEENPYSFDPGEKLHAAIYATLWQTEPELA
jgi:hypothetical protein